MRKHSPHHALLGGAAALSLLATACAGGGGGGDSDTLELWTLEDEVLNPLLQETIDDFNATSDVQIEMTTFVNDVYKERLQVGMGSPEHPDIFFSWGGGNLGQYVEADQVLDIDEYYDANPEFRDGFLPSVMDAVEFDGSLYGVPFLGVQPVSFFYNEEVFEEAGAEPPETYEDLLDLIDLFQGEDVTPIILPGAASWTMLMWVSYLVDRVGGADVYEAISMGEDGAWEDPAVVEAMERIQDLVDRGAFGTNFAAVDWDGGQATALLGEGEGAMILMGPWMVQDAEVNAPDLVANDALGYFPFPEVEDGDGDGDAVVGPLTNYLSIHTNAEHPDVAAEWLTDYMASDDYINGLIDNGVVPTVEGLEDQLQEESEFTAWLYDLAAEAPSFTAAWDQDLDPALAETMLTNFTLVFEGDMSPEEFAEAMEAAAN